jgi:hypothetical protein
VCQSQCRSSASSGVYILFTFEKRKKKPKLNELRKKLGLKEMTIVNKMNETNMVGHIGVKNDDEIARGMLDAVDVRRAYNHQQIEK